MSAPRRILVLHPILVALHAPVTLYARNAAETDPVAVIRPALFLVGVTLVVWALLFALRRDVRRTALVCSIVMLAILSWGHVAWALRLVLPLRAMLLFALYAAVVAVVVLRVLWWRSDLVQVTRAANAAAALLLLLPLATSLASGELWRGLKLQDAVPAAPVRFPADSLRALPDVYCIVLDGYARDDVLRDTYGFDNSAFLRFLEDRGFFVCRNSRANYPMTLFSLASFLNMDHLPGLVGDLPARSPDRTPFLALVRRNAVFAFFRQRGYRVVAFPNGTTSDVCWEADRCVQPRLSLNQFESALIVATPLPGLLRQVRNDDVLHRRHRKRTQFALRGLARLPRQRDNVPRFVFAHVVSPHPPFVFGADGAAIQPPWDYTIHDGATWLLRHMSAAEYRKQYAGQLQHTNALVQQALEAILEESTLPPIIVVISDHGPASHEAMSDARERFANLCALYPRGDCGFYDSLSLVNVFPLLLNCHFGTDMPLRSDASWQTEYQAGFEPEPVDGGILDRNEAKAAP